MLADLHQLAQIRVPRYTSYPTALAFQPAADPSDWTRRLRDMLPDQTLSLYVHVPYCHEVCWYCACAMKLGRNPEVLKNYTRNLVAEVRQLVRALPARMRVVSLHWGGGTPTAIGTGQMDAVMTAIRRGFDLSPEAEISVELDPRSFDPKWAADLAAMGTTRVSLGVQSFDPLVQATVNRLQPAAKVNQCIAALRAAGIGAINFDMMYGLPYQSTAVLHSDLEKALQMQPDRIALFGYAHVPWVAKRQRKIPEVALPEPETRFASAEDGARQIVDAGYDAIGLDHFARPSDSMAIAARDRRLKRNFQGYTVDPGQVLLGLGASAISDLGDAYGQNATDTRGWARAIEAGRLPVSKALSLSGEDRLRRGVISDIMCYLDVDLAAHLSAAGRPSDHFDEALNRLQPLMEAGYVVLSDGNLRLAQNARPILRLVAQAFDAYAARPDAPPRHAVAV